MNDIEDAHGQALWDYWRYKKGYEIIERDDDYIENSPGPKLYFTEYRQWPQHYKKALKHVKGRVLDIGCGAGRVALYLQNKGFETVGIDNSPLAIKTCRQRGLKKAYLMSLTQLDFGGKLFDTLLMLGNNFGLFGSIKRARWALRRFHRICSEKAIIIAEALDYAQTDSRVHLDYHKLNRDRSRHPGQIRIRVRYLKYKSPWFDLLLVTQGEMRDLLKGTGWQVRRFIDTDSALYMAIIERE